ncbi:unnamed protein product (macronuclear) [Paramecium tetraurelia]|uniref:Uncharacterized protein n=1 Tax=Paramecium tetraurelia TaxID=5888 RepID=A0BKJ4_PARTE|nr:uncharacterized protein GSPATT00029692001 [Paramecium tetraurelia]CAK59061.1 unnamed protein product [Paramecium tetraurelia]|eukprot:XP_001426459.1 hypothetical protein (macronuclear) [Paramecium tetraurelia strain d4-2]
MNNHQLYRVEYNKSMSEQKLNTFRKYCELSLEQKKDLECFTLIKHFINKQDDYQDTDSSNASSASETSNTVHMEGNEQQQICIQMFDIIRQMKRAVKQSQKLCSSKIKKLNKVIEKRNKEINMIKIRLGLQ